MARYADLHMHTTHSDGLASVDDSFRMASERGFACISITDHDTFGGLDEAAHASRKYGVEFMSGVEISATHENSDIHILGYDFDPKQGKLGPLVRSIREKRVERMGVMVAKLKKLGCNVEFNAASDEVARGTIGRVFLARKLVECGAVGSPAEAFAKYIGDDGPAYEPVQAITPYEAIEAILSAGGVAVMAHPGLTGADELIPSFIESGLGGIEVYHTNHETYHEEKYNALAVKHGLYVTGGSDSHGKESTKRKIGSVKLDYACVERIKSRTAERKLKTGLIANG